MQAVTSFSFSSVRKALPIVPKARGNLQIVASSSKVKHVEVEVGNLPFDVALKKFRQEAMNANVVPECRRRRYHEDSVDKKKRKQREKIDKMKKARKGGFVETMDRRSTSNELPLFAEDFGFVEEDLAAMRARNAPRDYRSRNPNLASSEEPQGSNGEDRAYSNGDASTRPKFEKVSIILENWAQVGRVLGYKGATVRAFSERTGVRCWVPTDELGKSVNFEVVLQGDREHLDEAVPLLTKLVMEGPEACGLPEAPEGQARPLRQAREPRQPREAQAQV